MASTKEETRHDQGSNNTTKSTGNSPPPSSLTVPIPSNTQSDLPPISALFLIDFDVKAGYTIAWKRAEPGLEIEGLVEYKSLPSGLHTVTDDLIYFVHDAGHAGLSAFVNEPCDEEEARHARMIAVGVLVPLSYGRLGRAWRHADGLKRMAKLLAKNRQDTTILEEYWEANNAKAAGDPQQRQLSGETPLSSPSIAFSNVPVAAASSSSLASTTSYRPKTHGRKRSMSDGTSLAPPEQTLSPYHPAWSLTRLLDQFGPLIFPIHRAALLRKRILISCQAPVHEVCDYVYDISILSNIPISVTDMLPTSSPTQRLQPLFSIGVHDIPFLMEDMQSSKRNNNNNNDDDDDDDDTAVEDTSPGWVACTTDSILAMKESLWDVLITMPPHHTSNAKEKVWPTIESPRGHVVKATQRDLRRFQCLRVGLSHLSSQLSSTTGNEFSHLQSLRSSGLESDSPQEEILDAVVEPLSWSALAYNGFMWWASAGEQLRSEKQEESSRDAALLADLDPPSRSPSMTLPTRPGHLLDPSLPSLHPNRRDTSQPGEARVELAIIAYFHRLTTQMLSTVADIYEGAEEAYADDDEDDDDDDGLADDGDEDEAPLHSTSFSSAATAPSSQRRNRQGHSRLPSDGSHRLLVRRSNSNPIILHYHGVPDDAAEALTIDSRSTEMMGLDVWSASDVLFIQGLLRLYFGRAARIKGKGVEVCGVRIC